MEKNNKNIKLNLLKGFGCMGVVFIHVSFPGMIGLVVGRAASYAVPIFYMIAGYYIYGKDADVVKRRLNNIIKIFLYAYILHFVYRATSAAMTHELDVWLSANFNWKTPIKYIFFCMVDFAPLLWYLIAMIETYIVWFFLVKKHKEEIALKTIPILFAFRIFLSVFCEIKGLTWTWSTNFIAQAMPWFLLGYYMHTKKADRLRNLSLYKLILLVVVGYALIMVTIVPGISYGVTCIGHIVYAMGLFALALKKPTNSVCKHVEYIGENLSMNIYILHNLVSNLLTNICGKVLGININGDTWLWCKPILVLICTIFMSWIFYIISNLFLYNQHKIRKNKFKIY